MEIFYPEDNLYFLINFVFFKGLFVYNLLEIETEILFNYINVKQNKKTQFFLGQ